MESQELKPTSSTIPKSPISQFGKGINDLQIHRRMRVAEKALMKFLSPARMNPNAQQRRFLDAAETSIIQVSGIPIRTYIWSRKPNSPSVLLSHGFMMNAATMLNFVQPLLAAGFRVVTWDHCGHGESGGDWTDMRVWVQSIHTIAQLNAPLAGMVNFSLGGTGALMALAQNPSLQCPLLVCINSPTQLDTVLYGFMKRHGCTPDLVPLIHQVATEKNILLPELIRSVLPTANGLPSTSILFIQDRDDNVATPMEADFLAGTVRHAKLEFTQGLKHHGVLSDGQVASLVTNFVIGEGLSPSMEPSKL